MRLVAAGVVAITAIASPSCNSRASAACRDNAACAADEYCAFEPALCGKGPKPGACTPRPKRCDGARAPVCGCDGRVHESECDAGRAGVDLSTVGGCRATVVEFIPCGSRYCDAHKSYCEIYLSDVAEIPSGHSCQPLPAACLPHAGHPPTCDCFPEETPCLSFCGPMITGGISGFHLTCQGVKDPRMGARSQR